MTTVINKKGLNPNHIYKKIKLKGTKHTADVYDHALPENVFMDIQARIFNQLPWFLESGDRSKQSYAASPLNNYKITDHTQFNHLFYHVSDRAHGWSQYTNFIEPVLNILSPRAWFRCKANYVARGDKKGISRGWHHDASGSMNGENGNPAWNEFKIAVLYLNTNNGYTIMETNNRVESVENRLVIFPNDVLHTAILQTDVPHRIVLNMVFLPYKEYKKK